MIGDAARFGVEYDLDDNYEGVWLFGKICFRIGGERVGNFELGTSLRDFLFQIEQGRRDHGRRRSKRFESMPAGDVVELIEGAVFGAGGDVNDRLAVEEQWARHRITPEVDVFDHWRIYLVESDVNGRLLYGRTEPGADVHEILLSAGECDDVLDQACQEIGALYEAENSRASG
jgi:hypothetical protein